MICSLCIPLLRWWWQGGALDASKVPSFTHMSWGRVSGDVQDDCEAVFQAVDGAGECKGKPIEALVTACFLASLKHNKAARTITGKFEV